MKKILPIILLTTLLIVNACPLQAAAVTPQGDAEQSDAVQPEAAADENAAHATAEADQAATGAEQSDAAEDETGLQLAAESAVLINARTGQILYEKEKDKQQFPASTTKIMTALLTLENKELDEVVTISHDASYTEGSRIYLLEGEKVTIEQLLYAMLLESANDAAIALAEAVGGSVEAFADMMNARAEELGAENTHFETPNGLPNDNHLTTAYDLALIAKEAMKNETFRKIVSTESYEIPATELQPEVRHINNTNKLLVSSSSVYVDGKKRPYKYDGILGIKTGYTKAAQSCLVAAAERDGMEIIGVILKSTPDSQYPDMIKLLDYGFDNYTSEKLLSAGESVGDITVTHGASDKVAAVINEDIYISKAKADAATSDEEYTYKLDAKELEAPVKKGAAAGTVSIYQGDILIGTYDIYAEKSVGLSPLRSFAKSMSNAHVPILIILFIIIMLILGYVYLALRIRRSGRRERAEREARREERRRRAAEYEAAAGRENDNFLSEYYRAKSAEQPHVRAQRLPGEKNVKNNLRKK